MQDPTPLLTLHHSPSTHFPTLVAQSGLAPAIDFVNADLRHVDFADTDLQGWNLCGADLRGARLDRARNARHLERFLI